MKYGFKPHESSTLERGVQHEGRPLLYSPRCAAKRAQELSKASSTAGETDRIEVEAAIRSFPFEGDQVKCVLCVLREQRETPVIWKSCWISTEGWSPLRNLRSSLWKDPRAPHPLNPLSSSRILVSSPFQQKNPPPSLPPSSVRLQITVLVAGPERLRSSEQLAHYHAFERSVCARLWIRLMKVDRCSAPC